MAEAKQVDFLINGVRDPLTDEPLAGGKVYTYEAGTSTLAALYIDRDTNEGEATNPVILDAYGRAEVFGNGVYKFVITDADDVTVIEMDNLEYYAVISDTAIPALTADLDFNGNRGTNLATGTTAGHTVEYIQFTDAIDTLETAAGTLGGRVGVAESDINAVKGRMATAESDIGTLKGRMAPAEADIGTLKGQMAAAESDIGTLQSEVDAVEDVVAGLSYAFTDLTDTPATLVGQAAKIPRVNAGGTALEFYTPAQLLATGAFLDLSDTPADYTGQQGKAPVVNAGADALEFAFPDARTLYGIAISATAPTNGQVLTYDSTLDVYKPATPASLALETLTPGTGITGDPYDGTVARTWTLALTGGVELVVTLSNVVAAAAGKKILAAAAICADGTTGVFIIPDALINSGVLRTQVSSGGSTYYFQTCTYTVGSGNHVSMTSTISSIARTAALIGDA